MSVLTNLKIKRWRYSSTAREAGFAVDTAEIEYADVSESTFVASASAFEGAKPDDTTDIYVTVGGVETLLFRGIIKDWRLEEGPDGVQTAVLTAEDERGKMLDTLVPPGLTCQGADIDFRQNPYGEGSTWLTPRATMLNTIQRLAELCDIVVDVTGAPDYVIGPDVTFGQGTTVGQAIARLLQAYQQTRRAKVDFIRTGINTYKVAQRPTTLSGGISVPKSAVKLRRYRKTYHPPVQNAVAIGFPGLSQESFAGLPAIKAQRCGGVSYEVVMPEEVLRLSPVTNCFPFANFDVDGKIQSDGQICYTKIGDRVLSIEVDAYLYTHKTATASGSAAITQTLWEKDQTFDYDGDGRLKKVTTTRKAVGVVKSVAVKTVNYDEESRILSEGFTYEEREDLPSTALPDASKPLLIKRMETIDKVPAGNVTLKDLQSWIAEDVATDVPAWLAGGHAQEVASGDSRLGDEPEPKWFNPYFGGTPAPANGSWLYHDPMIADQAALATVAQDVEDQGNKFLTEVEVEMPVDFTIMVHSTVDFGTGNLVNLQRVLVTEISAEGDDQGERMRFVGEVWEDGPATPPDPQGTVWSRWGIPTLSALRGRRGAPSDEARFMTGLITSVNEDGTYQVYVQEEGVVYPRVYPHAGGAGGRMLLTRDRVPVVRRGLSLWVA